jgi:hypothetical protein
MERGDLEEVLRQYFISSNNAVLTHPSPFLWRGDGGEVIKNGEGGLGGGIKAVFHFFQ